MRVVLCLAVLLFPQNPSSEIALPDLEAMFQKDEALRRLVIVYWPPVQKDWQQAFCLRGDGTVIKQAVRNLLISAPDIPTCTEHIGVEPVRALVRLIIKERFFDLPERRFIFMNSLQTSGELEMHAIGISDGQARARRSFGTGKFAGKQEVIPRAFAAIEEQLKQIRDSAFPPNGKDCRFAPRIKL